MQFLMNHFYKIFKNKYKNPIKIRLAVKSRPTEAASSGYGKMLILIEFGKSKLILKLSNVQCVKGLNENILSVRKINMQFHTSFNLNTNNGSIYSRKARTKIGLIRMSNELYRLPLKIYKPNDLLNSLHTKDIDIPNNLR